MYIPKHFDESRVEVMHGFMCSHPLATLVTLTASGIVANHIPMHISTAQMPYGVLQGHVARANPVWSDSLPDVEALVVFQGPDAYISPSWYATKQETGRVVPTWNYAVVHAYGSLRVIDDADWLRAQIEKLVTAQEASFSQSWQVSDAPAEYIDKLMGAIVGFEIVITRLSGKWKVSQNQPETNKEGVIRGLQNLHSSNALEMADLVPHEELNKG